MTSNDTLDISMSSSDEFDSLHEISSKNQTPISNPRTQRQTNHMVGHYLKHNQSYVSLEEMARIMNMMENASIRVPDTKYKIMKQVHPQFTAEFQLLCARCGNYTPTCEKKVQCVNTSCANMLCTSNSKYFVYLRLKRQLENSINEHWDEIMKNQMSMDNIMTDVHDAIQFKNVATKFEGFKVLSLAVCTDGAAIFNNNSQSLWAIQLYQNYLDPKIRYVPKNVLVVAFHCDAEKPKMKDFFHPLLSDLKAIHSAGGIVMEKNGCKQKFMPVITHFLGDLPAKIDVQEMKSYAGFDSCGFCYHPGVSIKSNPNSSYVRYIRRDKPEKLRTHDDMLDTYLKIQKKILTPINGVKGISCMIAAPHFNLIDGYGIDYMHCILLGVVKKLLNLWLNSINHSKPFYIKPDDQKVLNKRITSIKPTSEISRKPGPINKRAEYKANEFRTLLLYYLRYCLSGLLTKTYIDHFQLLSSSIYIMLKDRISQEEISNAEADLTKFADDFERLYGENNVTMDVHLSRHIVNAVHNLGPLWAQSAFALEANNGILTKTTAKRNVLHSITWKYNARCSLGVLEQPERDDNGISLKGRGTTILREDEKNMLEKIGIKFECVNSMTTYQRVFMHKKQFTSKTCKEISTIDYFVRLKGGKIGAVMFYFMLDSIVYSFIELYEIVKTTNHLLEVQCSTSKKIFEIQDIDQKLIYMKIGSREILTSRPNMYEKT